MGETVTYLGHVDIVPSLNQAEYDYLDARFGLAPGYGERDDGAPGTWCGWEACPHGCCLSWDGSEKFHAGVVWMQYLIDELLRPGARAAASSDPRFADFSFDHRLAGLVIGERSWSRQLFAIRVVVNVVTEEVLHPGEALPWEPGWDGRSLEDRPWLPRNPRPRRSSLDDPPPEPVGSGGPSAPVGPLRPGRRAGQGQRRSRVARVEPRD